MIDLSFLRAGIECPAETVEAFEKACARRSDRRWAVAVNSGSSALHVGLLALGVGPGDRVVIPSYVCAAILNAVLYVRARPVVADVSPEDGNLSADSVAGAMGKGKVAAVIVPHMFGLESPIEEMACFGIPVLEDFTMTVGGRRGGKPAGSRGTVSVASFYGSKMISTQQGGVFLCDDAAVARRVRDLCSYDGKPRYRLRFNYRMSGLAAALGLEGFRGLDRVIRARRHLAAIYRGMLAGVKGVEVPPDRSDHVYLRFVVRGSPSLRRRLVARGIDARSPVYRPLHRYLGLPDHSFPVTAELFRRSFCLPLRPDMTEEQVTAIARAVREEA